MAADSSRQILVIAKAPVPGRSNTRLVGVLSPDEAALVAKLVSSTRSARCSPVPTGRVVLALEGEWLLPDDLVGSDRIRVIGQRGHGLAERIEFAFADVRSWSHSAAIMVVSDSPQMLPAHLEELFGQTE